MQAQQAVVLHHSPFSPVYPHLAVFLLIRTMIFLSTNPDAPALRSRPFLWVRKGAVIFFLAIAALGVFPPNPALAFWSVAAPGWRVHIINLGRTVEWCLANESSMSEYYFDVSSVFSSQMRYNELSKESELSLTQGEKNIFAQYEENPDLVNDPLRGSGIFEDGEAINEATVNETTVAELDATLARTGSYAGVAYRVQRTDPEYIEGLEINGLYTDTAFSSASIKFGAAYNNAGDVMNQTAQPKVIFKRILKTGNVVSGLSDDAVSNDQQIVSRPNTVFKVRGIAKIQSEKYGEVTVVVEEEVAEGGLLKTNDDFLRENVKLYSGKKYTTSRGGRQARDRYGQTYNEDGTRREETGVCPGLS